MMTNIRTMYRGFEITKAVGGFSIHSGGSYDPVVAVFSTEDEARNAIDKIIRAGRLS